MSKSAAIYGNSQAGATGAVLESLLREDGWQVSRWFQNGAKAKAICAKAVEHPSNAVAIMFAGDASEPQMREVAAAYPRVVWVANPPATQITDLPKARAVFGSHVKTTDHWFSSGVAKEREDDATDLRRSASRLEIELVDPRQVVQPFPAQPDGIHMAGATAQKVAEAVKSAVEAPQGSWSWLWLAAGGFALWRAIVRGG